MENLKIKFKLHALEYEVEGPQDVAREEFKNFNDNILAQLLSKVNVMLTSNIDEHKVLARESEGSRSLTLGNSDTFDHEAFPTLKDVKLRDLPKSEIDWLVVYAFYASNYGTKEFTREDLLRLYKDTDRRTDNRIRSLSSYIKAALKALYIKSTNDTNFIILQK